MAAFKDNANNTWAVDVTVDTVKRVRSLLDVDLLGVLKGDLIQNLIGDPILLCDVLYAVCKPQADTKGITDEAFGQYMSGDAIDHATKALLEAIVDFSPSQGDRKNLQKVVTLAYKMMDKARDVIETKLESGDIEKEVDRILAKSAGSFGSAPASSESTPDP